VQLESAARPGTVDRSRSRQRICTPIRAVGDHQPDVAPNWSAESLVFNRPHRPRLNASAKRRASSTTRGLNKLPHGPPVLGQLRLCLPRDVVSAYPPWKV
jgi:hypothetical protein